ncbi:hypothetical protein [Streptomyces abikoensis]
MPKRQATAQKKARALTRSRSDVRYTEALTHYQQRGTGPAPSPVSVIIPIRFSLPGLQMTKLMAPLLEARGRAAAAALAPAVKAHRELLTAASAPALDAYQKLMASQWATPTPKVILPSIMELRMPRNLWPSG